VTEFIPRPPRRYFELTKREWTNLARFSTLVVFFVWLFRPDVTPWVAGGLLLTSLVFGQMCMTAARIVPFPGLVAFAACLQWVVGPWLATLFPPHLTTFRMAVGLDEYLRYAVPATVALCLGLLVPVHRRLNLSESWSFPVPEPLSKSMRSALDVTIVIGMAVDHYATVFPPSVGFLAYLIASFRFFAAIGWMVTETPGWWIRVVVVLVDFVAQQATGGVFYLVVEWGGYCLLVYAFMRQWRWKLAVAFVAGLLGLGLLQQIKPAFRAALDNYEIGTPVDSTVRLISLMWDGVLGQSDPTTETDVGDLLVRFNQGWIITRIMDHVPKNEPYAAGGTLVDAAMFSIVPRPLFPEKREGASQAIFTRFTGVVLAGNTRMGLSAIGELYANFGIIGGVAATFVYGYLLGWLFAIFAERAGENALWWAAAAMVVLPGAESGLNIEDIANHVIKAGALFLAVMKFVPLVGDLLAAKQLTPADSGAS
jgi:hypothetical protein